MNYLQLLTKLQMQEFSLNSEKNMELWDNVWSFLDIYNNTNIYSQEELDARHEVMNIILSSPLLSSFDYNNKEMISKIKNINISAKNEEPNLKKLFQFIRYHQEEIFKICLINSNFDDIPNYFVQTFSKFLFTEKKQLSTKENVLRAQADKMMTYFLEHNPGKLQNILSFSQDNSTVGLNEMLKVFDYFEHTSAINDVIAGYLSNHFENGTLFPHKNIELSNKIEERFFDYFFQCKEHWINKSLKEQGYLFSKIYTIYQKDFTNEENTFFKDNFNNYMEQVIVEDNSAFIFEAQYNLSLPILEYCPHLIEEIIENESYLKNVNDNFSHMSYQRNHDASHLAFLEDKDSFLFKTLFVNMMMYKNYEHHIHLAHIYKKHIDDSTVNNSSYLSGKIYESEETLRHLYKKTNILVSSIQENTFIEKEKTLFSPLLWVNLYHNKQTVEDYKVFFSLMFFHQQNSIGINRSSFNQVSHLESVNYWLECCAEELLSAPDEVLHTFGDCFEKIRNNLTSIYQSNFKFDDDSFSNDLAYILSKLESPNYSILDKTCVLIEEKILEKTVPDLSIKNKKNLKF